MTSGPDSTDPTIPGGSPYPLPPAYDPWRESPQPGYQPDPGQLPAQGYPPAPSYPPAQGYPAGVGYPTQGYPPPAQAYPPAPGYPPAQGFPPLGYPPVPPPKKRRARRFLAVAGLVSMVVVPCVGAAVWVLPSFVDAARDRSGHPTVAPPSGISATSTATAAPSGPFADTPAASYPEGEAALTLPEATAISGFTKDKVAAHLQSVRKGLIAARLDPAMLVSHDTSVLINLLAKDARADIQAEFTKKDFLSFASQIAPGYTLTSDNPRAKGRVTFRAKTQDGVRLLEVITNFVWVYPFSGSSSSPGDHLVIVHDEVHWIFPADADVKSTARGMWIDAAQSYASNIDCDLLDSSLLALGQPHLVTGGTRQDDSLAFDPNGTLDITSTC